MEKKRDLYQSPQQWAKLNNIELTEENKKIIFLLWRDLQKEISFWKQKSTRFERGFKRCREDLKIIQRRSK